MPYVHKWIPAPTNKTLTALKELPEGFVEVTSEFWSTYRHARNSRYQKYYYCEYDCKGWIEGEPNCYRENTLEPEHLAGRQGEAYYCRRCGREIAFSGMVS